jgi:uncharacterized protein YciI
MLCVVYNLDKDAGAREIRAATRPAHLEFMKSLGGKVKAGGPMLAPDGETPVGGMFVLQVDSYEEAVRLAALDPYARAGLFKSQNVTVWRWNTRPPTDLRE